MLGNRLGWHFVDNTGWHNNFMPTCRDLLKFTTVLLLLLDHFAWAEDNLTSVVACEGELVSLHCPPQHEIAIHLANFGRFTLQQCNPTNRLDLDTGCHNPRTIEVLRASCDHLQKCNVKVSTDVFGDKCPKSSKYLETSYNCIPTKATTTSTTTTTTLTTSASSTTTTTVALPSVGHLPFDGGGEVFDDDDDDEMDMNKSTQNGCPAQTSRNLHWPQTAPGQVIRMGCPKGTRGTTAEWYCSQQGAWTPDDGPSLAGCISDWARKLLEQVEESALLGASGEQREEWLDTLREAHTAVRKEQLTGGDGMLLGKVMAQVLEGLAGRKADRNEGILQLAEHEERRRAEQQESLEFVRLIIDTLGHLLRTNQRLAWADLPTVQRQQLAIQLLQAMPQTLALLLPLPNWPKAGSESLLAEPTLVAEVAQASIYEYVPFPSMSLYRQNFDTALLPREALQLFGQDLANVFYTAWDPSMGNYLLGTVGEQRQRTKQKIVTKLLSVSVVPLSGKLIWSKLLHSTEQPILLTFQNMEFLLSGTNKVAQPRCVWWDTETSEFVDDTKDSEKGNVGRCLLRDNNQTHFVCECNLLNTHFAVLANVPVDGENGMLENYGRWMEENAQFVWTVFLASILIALTALCSNLLLAFLLRPAAHTKGEQIKCAFFGMRPPLARSHFCFLLCLLEAIFLTRLLGLDNMPICTALIFVRDYLILAIICWTLVDAFQLCRSTRRFTQGLPLFDGSCYSVIGTSFVGYGFPLLMLAMMSLFSSNSNHSQNQQQVGERCWPHVDLQNLLLYNFTAPASILLFGAICCLIISFLILRTGNSKSAQKCAIANGGKFFAPTGYQPCSTNSTTTSSNGSKDDGIDERPAAPSAALKNPKRALEKLRIRLKWLCARMALLAAGSCAAIAWAFHWQQSAFVGIGLAIGIFAAIANAGIGIVLLAETVSDKKTRTAYQRWRNTAHGCFLLKPFDFLCCFTPQTPMASIRHHQKQGSADSSTDFPKLSKFVSHSPPGNINNGGTFTPNSSTSSAGHGTANGAMSACSELSATMEMHISSGSANSNNSDGNSSSNCMNANCQQQHPPPPAPLLQLYQEHNRLHGGATAAASPRPQSQQRQRRIGSMYAVEQQPKGNNDVGDESEENGIYEYATIPYEELLTAYRQQQRRGVQSPLLPGMAANCMSTASLLGARPIPTPRIGGTFYGQHAANAYLPSPRLLHNASPAAHLAMNCYGSTPGLAYSPGPMSVRLGMVGAGQVAHQQTPALGFAMHNEGMFLPSQHHHHHYGGLEQMPLVLEMGLHSAPPNFPPPPPPAPFVMPSLGPTVDSPVNFRRSSSGSLRSGGGGTLVLRMDLSRQQPLFSERIDDGVLDEAEEEQEFQQ